MSRAEALVIGSIERVGEHGFLGQRVAAGLRFLSSRDLVALEPGRHEINGDECYAIVEDYETKPRELKRWEAHRRHIDIQCVASGRELLGCVDVSTMRSAEYDPAKDLEFLEFPARPDGQFRLIEAGTFVILRPANPHMPGVAVDGPERVRKVVVKVLV